MKLTSKKNLSRFTKFFGFKLRELRYHLENIIDVCDESLTLFKGGHPPNDSRHEILIYGFSSYVNTIQSIKDVGGKLLPNSLPWSKIYELRHGRFMMQVRNASTHDGNPVITAWADGLFFVPNKIERLNKDEVIVIEPPKEDIRQLCLEFSADYAKLLTEMLRLIPDTDRMSMSILSMDELEQACKDSSIIPGYAKTLILQNRDEIALKMSQAKADHIAAAIKQSTELINYCNQKLAGEAQPFAHKQ